MCAVHTACLHCPAACIKSLSPLDRAGAAVRCTGLGRVRCAAHRLVAPCGAMDRVARIAWWRAKASKRCGWRRQPVRLANAKRTGRSVRSAMHRPARRAVRSATYGRWPHTPTLPTYMYAVYVYSMYLFIIWFLQHLDGTIMFHVYRRRLHLVRVVVHSAA